MTDDPHKASAAWQDVQRRLDCRQVGGSTTGHYCPNCGNSLYDIWPAVERARAADAQQIASLRLDHEHVAGAFAQARQEIAQANQQIAALRAENEKLQRTVDRQAATLADHANAYQRIMQLEAQLAALTAQPDGSLPTRQPKP